MATKRIVDTSFWLDDKVVENFSPEDKYFMLYLLTNPHTTQLGIYSISPKVASFELGYSIDSVNVLLDRFESKYELIRYNRSSKEVAIKNYLVYSIMKGGKPVADLLEKELKQVKSKSLIKYVFNNLYNKDNLNETVKSIINKYSINNNIYNNINDNDNDNDVSYHDSYNDSLLSSFKFSKTIEESINLWLQYKKEKKQTYKETGLKVLLDKIQKNINEYGEQYVIDAINNSISQNYSGIYAKTQSYKTNNTAQARENLNQRDYNTESLKDLVDTSDDFDL